MENKHKYKLHDVIEIDFFQDKPRIGVITELRSSQHYAIQFPFEQNEIMWFNRHVEQASRKLTRKAANSIKILYAKI